MSEKPLSPWQQYKKNLGDSRPWHIVTEKNNLLSEEDAKYRFDICQSCPELIQLTKQCKKCGCFMNLKTKLKNATCPVGKW